MKRFFSYKVIYDDGRIRIDTTVCADNLKDAWETAKKQLEYQHEPEYPRPIGYVSKGAINKKTTTIQRRYKKDFVIVYDDGEDDFI